MARKSSKRSDLGVSGFIRGVIEQREAEKAGQLPPVRKGQIGELAKCLRAYRKVYRENIEMFESAVCPEGLREMARARRPAASSPSAVWDAIEDAAAGRPEREEADPAWLDAEWGHASEREKSYAKGRRRGWP